MYYQKHTPPFSQEMSVGRVIFTNYKYTVCQTEFTNVNMLNKDSQTIINIKPPSLVCILLDFGMLFPVFDEEQHNLAITNLSQLFSVQPQSLFFIHSAGMDW